MEENEAKGNCEVCDGNSYCHEFNLHYCHYDGHVVGDLSKRVRLSHQADDCDHCPDLPGCIHNEINYCHYDGQKTKWTSVKNEEVITDLYPNPPSVRFSRIVCTDDKTADMETIQIKGGVIDAFVIYCDGVQLDQLLWEDKIIEIGLSEDGKKTYYLEKSYHECICDNPFKD